MKFADAKQVLFHTNSEVDIRQVEVALTCLADLLTKKTIDSRDYRRICKSLLDRVASLIASSPTNTNHDISHSFENIFLRGNAMIAFTELSLAIADSNEASEIAARILVMFVNEKTGGVSRLTQIISKADSPELVSTLVHLPSRIINVFHSCSMTEISSSDIITEHQYIKTLAEAIFNQTETSDMQRESFISNLLARLVIMKYSPLLISRFLALRNLQKLALVVLKGPQVSIEPLLRALLAVETNSKADDKRIYRALKLIIRDSPIARNACIMNIPFRRPLFKRPRTALKWLVKAIIYEAGPSHANIAIRTAAEVWSEEQFSLTSDIHLQTQVTRLLLYYLRYTANMEICNSNSENSVMIVLVQGIHHRLNENDIRFRRHGMVIGEAASRHCREDELLTFEREGMEEVQKNNKVMIGEDTAEDGGDSDFSILAAAVGEDIIDEEDSEDDEENTRHEESSNEKETGDVETSKRQDRLSDNGTCKERTTEQVGEDIWPVRNVDDDWQAEDDWSSISSYNLSSSSDEDSDTDGQNRRALTKEYAELRKKLSAPMSVPRLLGLLRELNSSKGGALIVDVKTALAALRTLAARAETAFMLFGTLRSAAVPLCLEVCRIDVERYPDCEMAELGEARMKALERVTEMDIVECGCALVDQVICGQTCDIGRRSEGLSVISRCVRGSYTRVLKMNAERGGDNKEEREEKRVTEIGRVTRRLDRSVRLRRLQREKEDRGKLMKWDAEGIERIFQLLAERLCEGGGAGFLDVEGKDCQLWGQGLVTLATLACHGGSGVEGVRMRRDVMEISVRRVGRLGGDGVVRRAVALALGGIIGGMGGVEVRERLVGGGGDVVMMVKDGGEMEIVQECLEWLQRAAEGDADIGVRRFAAIALQRWAKRVEVQGF